MFSRRRFSWSTVLLPAFVVATGVRAEPAKWFGLDGKPAEAANPVGEDGLIRVVHTPLLRVTQTTAARPAGTVLLLSGGGYKLLDALNEGSRTAETLNGFGYDVVALEYHVDAGAGTRDLALADAQAAWQLMTDRPERLGIHAQRLVVMGYSAGGHLAARLVQNTDRRPPDDVVLVYPAYLDEHDAGNPLPRVQPPARPSSRLIAMIGANDRPNWVKSCKEYADAWERAGGYAVYHEFKDAGHGFGMKPGRTGELAEWPDELQYLLEYGAQPGVGPFNTFLPWYLGSLRGRMAAFKKEAAADEGAIVFLGDSIIRKWELTQAFPGVRTANRGIAGDTTRGMLCRLQSTVLDLHPKAIVFMGGINDPSQSPRGTPATVAANVRSILTAIHAAQPTTPVLVCETLPSSSVPEGTVQAMNAAVEEVLAAFPQAHRVKTYAAFLNADGTLNTSLYVDNTHPNAAGYEVWRKILEPKLAEIGR